jgi:hypothetical protein
MSADSSFVHRLPRSFTLFHAPAPIPTIALFSVLVIMVVASLALSHPALAQDLEIEHQRDYFDRWYGQISAQQVQQMWDEVRAMPSEPPVSGAPSSVNSWQLLGPLYSINPGGGQMTGRVRDIDAEHARVLSASGGLWRFNFGPVSMSDAVPASWFGSFATNPSYPDTILLGTGEYTQGSGTGLYMTTDGGTTWVHQSLGGDPYWISKVRWNVSGTVAYVASVYGLYRSSDMGLSWQRTLNGDVTDVSPVPHFRYPSLVYAAVSGSGLWRSTDAGLSWTQMVDGGIPTSGTGHGSVSCMEPSGIFPPVSIYVSFTSAGVWRSLDGGSTWTNITPSPDVNRFAYNNVIAVSPADQNRVFLGGVGAKYSSDGGTTWNSMVTPHLHADYHVFSFDHGGTGVWAGNDGGWSHSTDLGPTWDSSANVMPITQFYDIACERTEAGVMVGGAQDNNILYSPDESLVWTDPAVGSSEGDGSGCAVDQFTTTRLWAVQGVYGGDYAYHRSRSIDGGATWQETDDGIDPNPYSARVRQDGAFNPTLVSNAGPYVYESTDQGATWAKANVDAFPANVVELTSSVRSTPDAVLYACLSGSTTGQRLYVRDAGVWFQRDFGLPAGAPVHKVATHPFSGNYTNEAWALMGGTSTPGEKVFHTTSRGVSWENITGNLPNVPMGDLVPDPLDSNHLFLGTALGCYRTADGGATWVRWNNGLPDGVIVTSMTSIDERGSGGPLYIVAGTYGRSVFLRDATGDDPVSVPPEVARGPRLFGVTPNPLSSAARLSFVLRQPGRARVEVFDAGGRRVAAPIDENLSAGAHVLSLDERSLPGGTYFFRLEGDPRCGGSRSSDDRVSWAWLSRVWSGRRDAPFIVKPETVIGWRPRGFRERWTRFARSGKPARSKGALGRSRRRTRPRAPAGSPLSSDPRRSLVGGA